MAARFFDAVLHIGSLQRVVEDADPYKACAFYAGALLICRMARWGSSRPTGCEPRGEDAQGREQAQEKAAASIHAKQRLSDSIQI